MQSNNEGDQPQGAQETNANQDTGLQQAQVQGENQSTPPPDQVGTLLCCQPSQCEKFTQDRKQTWIALSHYAHGTAFYIPVHIFSLFILLEVS